MDASGKDEVLPKVKLEKALKNQKALVTGANSGLGRAIAVALGEAGADVVVNYYSGEQAAEAVVKEIQVLGSSAYARRQLTARCAVSVQWSVL